MRRAWRVAALVVGLAWTAACSGGTSEEASTTRPTTTQPSTTRAPSTTRPSTSTAPPTTAAPATTVPESRWAPVDRLLEAAPHASLYIGEVRRRECTEVHGVNGDDPLAIATSAGVYLVGAADRAVTEGFTAWDTPFALRDKLRSIGTGELASLTDPGLVFTMQRMSEILLSSSDTTAFDHLLDGLGRGRVEEAVADMGASQPYLLHPFLATREAFSLKLGDPVRLLAYDREPPEARLLILDQLDPVLPGPEVVAAWVNPIGIGSTEWHASTADMCRALADLAAREVPAQVLAASPVSGLDAEVWTQASQVQGREPGVANLTWYLEREDGSVYVASVTLNDPDGPVDDGAVRQVLDRAVALLAEEP